jgi:hypothetical protein
MKKLYKFRTMATSNFSKRVGARIIFIKWSNYCKANIKLFFLVNNIDFRLLHGELICFEFIFAQIIYQWNGY